MEKTVVKAFKALEVLCREEAPMGVTQVARALAINKSNAHRLLGTLVGLGYARRTDTGAYAPSLRIWELGSVVRGRHDVGRIARPYLPELCARTGETVLVAVLDGCDTLYLEKQESAHPVRVAAAVGARLPSYCSASGRVLLAFAPDAEDRMREIEFKRYTPNTIASVKELRTALEKVRQQGYELSVREFLPGMCGLAVPVRDSSGTVVAALGLTALSQHVSGAAMKRLLGILKAGAAAISRDLGYLDTPGSGSRTETRRVAAARQPRADTAKTI
jgi:IclR family transcriptional regulator, KDG regulon repressor